MHAANAAGRTVLRRLRYEGVMRCSRAFARDGAALVVTSQLGPGVVHGDRLRLHGALDAGAHLIVTAQSATRVLGGERPASAEARWDVAAGAVLELIGEPLVPTPGSHFATTVRVALAGGARVLLTDAVRACAHADVRARTIITVEGRECFYDALDVARVPPGGVGTLALFGLCAHEAAAAVNVLEAACAGAEVGQTGVGAYPAGVFVRVHAHSLWLVRETLSALRTALGEFLISDSSGTTRALPSICRTREHPACGTIS
ncbi:MAG: hypothetical protein NVS3B28_10940 [Candidatus Velthaea sp.]